MTNDDVAQTDQMTDEEAIEAAEIRADIDETRQEMGGTLQELGDRLEPGHLMDQAKENVREATIGRLEETAKGVSDMVMETIRRNPVPAAMAGAGLALLWANRSGGRNGQRYATDYRATSAYGRREEKPMVDRAREVASDVGETVGRAREDVGRTVGDVRENVGTQLERWMEASPLALGVIAAGAGALIGAVLPSTQPEREMLSDAGRTIGNAVRETVDQATTKAEEAMDQVEEKVETGSRI